MEMRLPLVIALNMMDMARERGIQIDTAVLRAALAVRLFRWWLQNDKGSFYALQAAIAQTATERSKPLTLVHYQPVIEDAISALSPTFQRMLASAALIRVGRPLPHSVTTPSPQNLKGKRAPYPLSC